MVGIHGSSITVRVWQLVDLEGIPRLMVEQVRSEEQEISQAEMVVLEMLPITEKVAEEDPQPEVARTEIPEITPVELQAPEASPYRMVEPEEMVAERM